ncbi:MAG: hypothetical protein WCJ71_10040 [Candidatus Omnitrophota bacterium]
MKIKDRKMICWVFVLFFICFFSTDSMGYDARYEEAVRRLDERVAKEHAAYAYEKAQDFSRAIALFNAIAQEYGNSAVASPSRTSLIRLYEKTGQFDKALEQVEWFLKGNQNEQGRQKSLADKQRLLKEIKETS